MTALVRRAPELTMQKSALNSVLTKSAHMLPKLVSSDLNNENLPSKSKSQNPIT